MKARILKLLVLALLAIVMLFAVSCKDKKDESIKESIIESEKESVVTSESEKESSATNENAGISFNTLSVDGTKVYGKVSNSTQEFSFPNEIEVVGNADFIVSLDSYGTQTIITKTIPLSVGDNEVYIFETINGKLTTTYTVTIRRLPTYIVSFNTNGGSQVANQTIEENSFANKPETTRTGYTFTGWDYDFSKPITQNTKITASWSANKDTKYTVNYYLQNLDDDNYTLQETVKLKGETDTTATAEIKEYPHFTYNENASAISGNIDGDGGQILSVYYTRDSYDIIANNNNEKAGTVSGADSYKYNKQITLTATTNIGYTWLGWYDGETLACETEEFTFKAKKDVTYTASWSANKDTKYTVNYYWQNIDDDNYTLHESVGLEGETDTTATAEIKAYTHFTYNASKSTISGNINGDGSRVLSVYYTRNTYSISVNNTSYGCVTNSGNHKYGKEITSTATPHLGYEFIGWYSGEELLSADSTYTFTVNKNVTAKFTVKAEMSYFNFSATATTCSITGIKDETITEIVVPDYVTSIGNYAFYYCSSLTSITIPDSVTSIGNNAFSYCDNLTSVVIPDSVTSIGESAFESCSNLTSVVIPDSVTSIGESAFESCYKIVEVVNKSTHITVTKGATSNGYIGYYALAVYNSGDTFKTKLSNDNGYIVYTDGDEKILVGYTGTETDLIIPSYITEIYNYAFYGCRSLTSVVIPDSVTSIGNGAFCDCDNLTSITIPDSVTSIGNSAFSNCRSLTSITIPNSVTSIGYMAFYFCDSLASVTIPNGVTSIGNYAFSYCRSLTSVEIGDSVTSIGNYAFYSCDNLTSVVIPDSVTSIGNSAFRYCYNLTSVVIPDSVTSIGNSAFSDCDNLTSVVIPDSVTSIGKYAFYSCDNLKSVEIGDSVTSIGEGAFLYCSNLKSVYYKGTASDWTKIPIGFNNEKLTSAKLYYYSETEPTESGNYWHYDENGNPVVW